MKIWVTRDEEPGGPLSSAMEAAGLEPVLEPVIMRRVLTDAGNEIGSLGPADWLVLTSVYAIEAVAADAARVPRVAVVGESSREKAEELGLRVELVSAEGSGRDLFERLSELARGVKVCYPRSSLAAPPDLPEDVELVSPVLYETISRDFRRAILNEVDAAAVASPSAVRAIGRTDLPLASIGPSTSAAIRELGMEPWLEAPKASFDALAQLIADQAKFSRNQRA